MLFAFVIDLIVLEQRVVCDDPFIKPSFQVLGRHEVFCNSLHKVIAKEFISDPISLKVGVLAPFADVADCLAHDRHFFWVLRPHAAVCAGNSSKDGVNVLHFFWFWRWRFCSRNCLVP